MPKLPLNVTPNDPAAGVIFVIVLVGSTALFPHPTIRILAVVTSVSVMVSVAPPADVKVAVFTSTCFPSTISALRFVFTVVDVAA